MSSNRVSLQIGEAPLDPRSPIELRHLKTVVRSLSETIGEHVEQRLSLIIRRIEQLEARPLLEYTGVHEVGREYQRGEIVTHDGSMFYAKATTRSEPPADAWQCCVKRGRDARGPR